MTTNAGPNTCQHQHDVEVLTQISLTRSRSSTASVISSKMLTDEKMAACQAECGDSSPYRDVELHPIPEDEAVALVERSNFGYIDIILNDFADMARTTWQGVRRLVTRPSTKQ